MDQVQPRELQAAARITDALVYAAGLAGVIAGGLLFREGQVGFAVVAWALTFVAGAGLRLASYSARALAALLVRTERMQAEISDLRGTPPAPPRQAGTPPDPYRRWGGWH
jgi:hypothetical protein